MKSGRKTVPAERAFPVPSGMAKSPAAILVVAGVRQSVPSLGLARNLDATSSPIAPSNVFP